MARIGTPTSVGPIYIDATLNTAGQPGLSFFGDATTGMFRDASGNIGFATAATGLVLTINTSGSLEVPTGYEALVAADEILTNKKYVDDAIVAATPVDLNDLPQFNVTLPLDANDFLVANGSDQLEDKTPTEVVTILGLNAGGANDIWVEKAGDAMDPGANLLFSAGGEPLGLPATPSANDAGASKAYVDSLTAGLNWVTPVFYIDFLGDGQGGVVTKDYQTPVNDTNAFVTSVEDSDMMVCNSGVGVNWTATGITGNTLVTVVNAGDVMRWDSDVANGFLDPEWERVGHIADPADFADCETAGVHQAPVRWGVQIDTAASPGGFLAGFTTPIVELIVQDIDSDVSLTEHDALWGCNPGCGSQEVVQITTLDHTTVSGSDFFTIHISVGSDNLSPTKFVHPTNAVPHTGAAFYVWFTKDAVGADPTPPGHIEGIGPVPVVTGESPTQIAAKVKLALDAHRVQLAGTFVGQPVLYTVTLPGATNVVEITDQHAGRSAPPVAGLGLPGWGYAETVQGTHTGPPNSAAFYVSNPGSFNFGNQYVYNATPDDWVLFGGSQVILPGIGLSQVGQFFHVNLGAGMFERPIDEIGIELYSESGGAIILTIDGTTRDTSGAGSTASAASTLALKTNTSQFTQVTELTIAASGVTETELHTSVAGAGLGGGAGTPLEVNVDGAAGVVISSDAVSLSGVPSSVLATDSWTIATNDGGPTGSFSVALGDTWNIIAGAGIGATASLPSVTISADVVSVHGRTGSVAAQAGDYNAAEVNYTPGTVIGASTVQQALDLLGGAAGGTFTGLSDTPGSYAASALHFLRVNGGQSAVEFIDLSNSGIGISGALLVGVDPTSITNSVSTNVQDVLEDLDAAIGAGALTNRIQDAGANDTYVETDLGAGNDDTIRMRVGAGGGNHVTGVDVFEFSAGGGLNVFTPDASGGAVPGGDMDFLTGKGDGAAQSGAITLTTGDQTALGGDSGSIEIKTGPAGTLDSGAILLQTGAGNVNGGNISLVAGSGGTTNGAVIIDRLDGVAGTPGILRLVADNVGTPHNIDIQAPSTGISAGYTLTLPIDDGILGEVLTTNGSGGLSWAAAGVSTFIGLSDTPVQYTGVAEISDVTIVGGAGAGLTFPSGGAPGSYFTINSANDFTTYDVWYNVTDTGSSAPPPGPATPIMVAILSTDSDVMIATKTASAINTLFPGDFNAVPTLGQVVITNQAVGVTTDIADGAVTAMPGGTMFNLSPTQGVDGHAFELVRVNAGETAVEFVDPTALGLTFIDLTDTPALYASGDAGKSVAVNAGETAVEFVDRQPVTYLRDQTPNVTPVELSTDGAGGGYYDIATGTAEVLDISVIGRRSTGASHAAWNVKVVVENTAGTAALVGTPVTTIITNAPGWALVVGVTGTRITLTVTGGAFTVDWKATITSAIAP